ncbi:MAG: Flp pilus assembly complex ATPase component TadA [Candidatus Omnitrophica bacterium]|nr:Flp pilus assembly complex ATPase component TadA [Candidatus Omnitrophota bacterium]
MDKKTDRLVAEIVRRMDPAVEEDTLTQCFRQAEEKNRSPVPYLCRRFNLREDDVLRELAAAVSSEYIDLKTAVPDADLVQRVPVKIVTYYKFFPLEAVGHVLKAVMAYPPEVRVVDEIRTHLGYEVTIVLGREQDILDVLNAQYGLGAETLQRIIEQKTYEGIASPATAVVVEDLEKEGEDASVIQLVNQIIREAYLKRASDIHIEPYRSGVRFRYRIDGVLVDAHMPPQINTFITPILTRIKLMANLNIVERRVPQDGRAVVRLQDQKFDLRISCIPTPHGESIVIRILPTGMMFSLDGLGFSHDEQAVFEQLIRRPHGIIFLTGPTGSGKSTTLYAGLAYINKPDIKIITIEDPIEYEVEGITQIQVVPDVGFDFARGLRSMLRHDPDVMMVGEVRDKETAEIAIRVALTGHLVLSTLHTNDAASGATRLIDIGVEPYLVASSVDAFIAQRLLRLICPLCRAEELPLLPALSRQMSRELGAHAPQHLRVYRGRGCAECGQSGFKGRSAIYEILTVNEPLKRLITEKAACDRIKKTAMEQGMRTLRQSGWMKVVAGMSTADEIARMTPADEGGADATPENSGADAAPAVTLSVGIDAVHGTKPLPPGPVNLKQTELIGEGGEFTPPHPAAAEKAFNPADRRIFERLDDGLFVRFKIVRTKRLPAAEAQADFEPEYAGLSRNISAGGLLFTTTENLSMGGIIDMAIEMPDGEKPIQCLGRVVRSTAVVAEKGYDTAICFLDLPNAERARINRYVLRLSKTK